jgi:hypothetical protein
MAHVWCGQSEFGDRAEEKHDDYAELLGPGDAQ